MGSRLALLADVAAALGTADDVGSVMQSLTDVLVPGLADVCEVVLVSETQEVRRIVSGGPYGPGARRERQPLPDVPWHPVRAVMKDAEVRVISGDDPASRDLLGPPDDGVSARALGVGSAIVAPMVGRSGVVGTLNVGWRRRDAPDAESREFTTAVARLAALAVERLDAINRQRRTTRRLARLGSVAAALSAAIEPSDIAEVLVTVAREEFEATTGLVYLVDNGSLQLAAQAGYDERRLDGWRRLPMDADAPAAEVCRSRELLVLENLEDIIDRYPYVREVEGFADRALIAVPIQSGTAVLGAAFWAFDQPRRIDEEDRRFVETAAEQCASALERAATQSRLDESMLRLDALDRSGVIGIIAGEGDRIVRANDAFLGLLGIAHEDVEQGRIAYPALTPPAWKAQDEAVVEHMLAEGRADPFEKEYWHADGTAVPVMVGGATLSVEPFRWIVFVADMTEQKRAEAHAEAARSLAERAQHRLEELLAHQRHVAQTLQTSLLPPELPVVPGFEVAAAYWPAGDGSAVGGDFYDVIVLGDGAMGTLIGDVCGKGVEAAAVTAAARHSARAAALHLGNPAQVLRWVHDALRDRRDDRFCTAAYATFVAKEHGCTMTLSLGGHPAPFVVRPNGQVEAFGTYGSALGILTEPSFTSMRADLGPGDLVVFYTDGITDAPVAETMDEGELADVLAHTGTSPLADIGRAIERRLQARRPNGSRDDVALLLVRVTGRELRG